MNKLNNYVYSKSLGTSKEIKKMLKKLRLGGAVREFKGNTHAQGGIGIDENYNAVYGGKNNRQSKMYKGGAIKELTDGEAMVDVNYIMSSQDPIARDTALMVAKGLMDKNERLKAVASSKYKMEQGGMIDPPEDGDFLKGLINAGVMESYNPDQFGVNIPYDDMNKILSGNYDYYVKNDKNNLMDMSSSTFLYKPYDNELSKTYEDRERIKNLAALQNFGREYGGNYDNYIKTVPSDFVTPPILTQRTVPSDNINPSDTSQRTVPSDNVIDPSKLGEDFAGNTVPLSQRDIDEIISQDFLSNEELQARTQYDSETDPNVNINTPSPKSRNISGSQSKPKVDPDERIRKYLNNDPEITAMNDPIYSTLEDIVLDLSVADNVERANKQGLSVADPRNNNSNTNIPDNNTSQNTQESQGGNKEGFTSDVKKLLKDPIGAGVAFRVGTTLPSLFRGPEKEALQQNPYNQTVRSLAMKNRVDLDPLRRTAINQRNSQNPNTRSASINEALSANANNQLTSNLQTIDMKQQEADVMFRNQLSQVLMQTGESERGERIRKQTIDSQNKAAWEGQLENLGNTGLEVAKYVKQLNVRDKEIRTMNDAMKVMFNYIEPEASSDGGINFRAKSDDKMVSESTKELLRYVNSLPDDHPEKVRLQQEYSKIKNGK